MHIPSKTTTILRVWLLVKFVSSSVRVCVGVGEIQGSDAKQRTGSLHVKCMVVVLLGSHSDTPDIIGNFMKLLKKR